MRRQLSVLKSRLRVFIACALYVASRALPASLRANHNGKTRVLVFHHIDDAARFRSILIALKARFSLISYQQYLDGQQDRQRINVIIALDDGYRSWHTAGLPLFKELGIRPMLFINSDFIGKSEAAAHTFCRENITTWPEASMSWDEVKALDAHGAEFGGHGLGHPNLSKLKSSNELLAVLTPDKATTSQQLAKPIRSFAYPFGIYNAGAAQAVELAGYTYAFTSDSGFLEDSQGPYLLKRSNTGLRPALVACAIVEGWADKVSDFVALVKGKRSNQWAVD